ncbi:MAG: PAS domain S-box protein [Candidatus Omnitrophica bacterium]|nr:PAS domain S-box protein [Candidatus Omnitrophota bacterium]
MFQSDHYFFQVQGIPLVLTALIVLIIGVVGHMRLRRTDPNIYFFALCVSLFIWLAGSSISYFSRDEMTVRHWYRYVALLGLTFIGPNSFFATKLATRSRNAPRWYIISIYAVTTVVYALNAITPYMSDGVRQIGPILYPAFNKNSIFFLLFFFPFMIFQFAHLVERYRSLKPGIDRDKIFSLIGGFSIASLAVVDFLPAYGLNVYPFGYLPIGMGVLFISYVFWRYQQALITPEIAADEIIDLLPDFLILVDSNQLIQRVNRAVFDRLGYATEQLVGRALSVLVKEKDVMILEADTLSDGTFRNREMTFMTQDGREIPVLFSCVVVQDELMGLQGGICMAQDITELKQTRKQLTRSYQDLKQTHDDLIKSEKMAGIGQLAAGIAHEINNPTGFIKSNFETLGHYVKDYTACYDAYSSVIDTVVLDFENQLRSKSDHTRVFQYTFEFYNLQKNISTHIQKSLSNLFRIQKVVSQFRSFASNEDVSRTSIHINDLLDRVISLTSQEWSARCEIKKDFQPTPRLSVKYNPLEQSLIVLLLYLVQETTPKGQIEIKTFVQADDVVTEMVCHHMMLTPDKMRKRFHVRPTVQDISDINVGLYMVAEVIKNEDGQIETASCLDQGVVIQIKFPFKQ